MSRNPSLKLLPYLAFRNTCRFYLSVSSLCYQHTMNTSYNFRLVIPRCYTSTKKLCKDVSIEYSNTVPPKSRPKIGLKRDKVTMPANLNMEQYHTLADSYLSELEEKLLDLQEKNEGVDIDFSAGVLTLTLPLKGDYVLNKQPPNKQIWLSSPISGPMRFDYVIHSEVHDSSKSMGCGQWVCMRDGTSLSNLLKKECQIHMTDSTYD